MDQEQKQAIQELAELLHQNNLSEIEYEVNGVHLRVVGPISKTQTTPAIEPVVVPEKTVVIEEPKNYIRSPMVGVAYLSKEQGLSPYVQVGDMVTAGQTVCLVEAMKTFNPVKAEQTGRIVEVLVESGSPVEYNQPLFRVE